MTTEQREVLDAIHVAWKANPKLTLPQLFIKAFPELQEALIGVSEWELMTNTTVETVLLELAKG